MSLMFFKHVVSYSIAQGDTINVVAMVSEPEKEGTVFEGPWVAECSPQELLACYEGWEPEVGDLLECIDNPTKWALHHLNPLPLYVVNNVVLVGDAAHAMPPHQGAGAGQAIEDAYVLAQILGSPLASRDTLFEALKAYEHVRLPIANHVLEGSRESGQMYEFDSSLGCDYERLGPAIQQQWDWVWASQPGEDAQRGINCLRPRSKL